MMHFAREREVSIICKQEKSHYIISAGGYHTTDGCSEPPGTH